MDRAWSYEDAEWIYDQENDYKITRTRQATTMSGERNTLSR